VVDGVDGVKEKNDRTQEGEPYPVRNMIRIPAAFYIRRGTCRRREKAGNERAPRFAAPSKRCGCA